MPIYPALALLLASAIAAGGVWISRATRVLSLIAAIAGAACFVLIFLVRHVPAPRDISSALSQHPGAYTLALGHMLDLTLDSFAYLRIPLAMAGAAFLLGALGTLRADGWRAALATSVMMVLFFQAARMAMVTFDPFLSSRPLANAILQSPPGQIIMGDQYYTYSSIFFYTGQNALLLNGRYFNLEYGSYAPGAADVFIDQAGLKRRWAEPGRYYLVADHQQMAQLNSLLGTTKCTLVVSSGGKFLLANHPPADPGQTRTPSATPSP